MKSHHHSPRLFTQPLLLALTAGWLFIHAAPAQEVDELVDTLVAKKLLTTQDAQRIKASAAKQEAPSSASKLKLTESITEMRLYGELRFRYQYDQADAQQSRPSANASNGSAPTDARLGSSSNVNQRSRERFRLRLGADFKLGEQFFGGFGLSTNQASDTSMQTYTGGFDNFGIFINKAFLGWKAADWLTIVLGKQENPFYTTDLVWDPDIYPQGIFESVDIGKHFFPDSKLSLKLIAGQLAFYDNDEFRSGHDASTDAAIFSQQLKATYNFNQDTSLTFAPGFLIETAADLGGLLNSRAFSDASFDTLDHSTQTSVTTTSATLNSVAYDKAGVPTLTVTPINTTTTTQITDPATGSPRTVTTTTIATQQQVKTVGDAVTGLPGIPVNLAKANQTFQTTKTTGNGTTVITNPLARSVKGETRNLQLLTFPGDLSLKIGGMKTKFYWDVSFNLAGQSRFTDTYGLENPVIAISQNLTNPSVVQSQRVSQHYNSRDSLAWLVGLQIGDTKKAGDWAVYANYREVGVASIDPNLNDSDWGQSALNLRGIKVGASYNFTNWLTGVAAYSHAWNLDRHLIGGQATGGASLADLNNVNVFQLDLNVKF